MSTIQFLIHFVFVCLSLASALGLTCKHFMTIDAAFKVKKSVHVFYEKTTVQVDSLGPRKDFPRLSPIFIHEISKIWPNLEIPVATAYASRSDINFITKGKDYGSFYVWTYNLEHAFQQKQNFSNIFRYTSNATQMDGFKIRDIHSSFPAKTERKVYIFASGGKCIKSEGKEINCKRSEFMAVLEATISGDKRANYFFPNPKDIPSAILGLDDWSKRSLSTDIIDILAFYGPFFMMMPMTGTIFKGVRHQYKGYALLNTHWLGCPQVFCFEADIDALLKDPETAKLVMFRGLYHWTFDGFPVTGEPRNPAQNYPGVGGYVDAAFSDKSQVKSYLFKGDTLFVKHKTGINSSKISEVFKGLERDVDAAFAVDDEVYIFKAYYFWVYSLSTKIAKEVRTKLTKMKGMPSFVDSAVAVDSSNLFILKGNFNYRFNLMELKSRGPFQQKASHETIFKCPEGFYAGNKDFASFLDITDFDTFLKFRKLTRPKPMKETDIPSTSTIPVTKATTTRETSTNSVSKKPATEPSTISKSKLLLVVLIVAGVLSVSICVIFAGLIALAEMRHKKKEKKEAALEAKDKETETDVEIETLKEVEGPKQLPNTPTEKDEDDNDEGVEVLFARTPSKSSGHRKPSKSNRSGHSSGHRSKSKSSKRSRMMSDNVILDHS